MLYIKSISLRVKLMRTIEQAARGRDGISVCTLNALEICCPHSEYHSKHGFDSVHLEKAPPTMQWLFFFVFSLVLEHWRERSVTTNFGRKDGFVPLCRKRPIPFALIRRKVVSTIEVNVIRGIALHKSSFMMREKEFWKL